MRLALFGATGKLGEQLARQALGAGHEVCALVRNPARLAADLRDQLTVIEGDALQEADVARVLEGVDHVLFALGCDGRSPPNLCTDSTRLIIARLRSTQRFVWCGGGSNLIEGEDAISFGPRFVRWWAATFMTRKHMDKENQLALLRSPEGLQCAWFGVRPLQMGQIGVLQVHTGKYRLGMDPFNGMSKISFADCADAMIKMLTSDGTWQHRAPIVQY